MALFDKLFSLKRRLDSENCEPRRDRGRSCQINPQQVRLLLFKECDWRGRRLLFDSSAIHKVPAGKNDKPTIRKTDETPCIVEVSDGYTYVYKGPEADASVLGEMIFGAVAMNCKSVSLKIHIMDEPRRLMCTKVFCVPVSRRISRVERKTSDRLDVTLINASKPLNVPSLREEGVSLSFSLDRGDSGFCGDHSPYSSVSSTYDYFSMFETWDENLSQEDFCSFHSLPGRKLSTSSNGSWHRRTFQNIATRFDLGQSSQLLNPPNNTNSSDSQIYSNSSTSGTSDSLASGASTTRRKNKLGLAVLITVTDSAEMDLVRRCLEHSPQIQALVCRLRLAALSAGAGAFVSTLHTAAENAARGLSDLIYGPRLQPMWLSLVTQEPRASHKLADSLLADLCSVLAVGDTKTTHFFISTLLTHVLTYHLGWVTTVSPYDTVEHRPPPSQARPYNALWAQLSDLCGSIGFPPRAARTILSGEKNQQFINRLLLVLTYFLRCGDVTKNVFKYQDSVIKEMKTVSVNKDTVCALKRTATRNKLDRDVPVNTQNSDSSVSTLIASEVSFKRSTTLASLSHKLSTSSEVGSSTGDKSAGRRRNAIMHSIKSSSDSSLNSTTSEECIPEQKVLFVLGDDEKLVGLKNKSNGGKMVKKSSKVHNEPVNVEKQDCVKESCDRTINPDSPSKCCGQTLQHSKPIKHSGFKFEFDKYPQIVTNYMKSKNLEILDRHYIGKPGNLKMDNFQFDPTIVPAIQEERCETCVKCQMESMLQTPTNASEMEYMNDMPRALEPQYAHQTVVTQTDTKREMSPKTFVRKRKDNTLLVNLAKNIKSVSDGEVNREFKDLECDRLCANVLCSKEMATIPIIRTPQSEDTKAMNPIDDAITQTTVKLRPNKSYFHSSKLKATKSLGNLNILLSEMDDTEELDTTPISTSDWKISSNETLHISTNVSESTSTNEIVSDKSKTDPEIDSITFISSTVTSMQNTISSSEKTISPDELTSPISFNETTSSNQNTASLDKAKRLVSSDDSLTTISSIEETKDSKSVSEPTITSDEEKPVSKELQLGSTNEENSMLSEANTTIKPTLLEIKISEPRRSRDIQKIVDVKRVIEFPLPQVYATEDKTQRSGFDGSLLGGVTDHYVPDLILQGTLAKPIMWENELRRDLDLTSYLNKTMDAPIQPVAIIGDTNKWEVRVVGRDCGTGGMSSLVGAMLDALPAMWKAKVPAHQCLSFLESKLREFCVLSKTLADMLMSTDFCDIATLTKSLNIDVNDVPLLLAVATTHTPQVATRYGLSYR